MGIEPTPSAWEAEVLPLNYSRNNYVSYFTTIALQNQLFSEMFAINFRKFAAATENMLDTALLF